MCNMNRTKWSCLIHLLTLLMCLLSTKVLAKKEKKEDQLWHQDMTEDMKIGPADSGYKRVDLRCLDEEKIMQVDIEMDEEFSGVIYARGNFHSKNKNCFLKPKPGKKFSMKIPFDDCSTKKEADVYKNIIVIQYDDELIMPGDAAFALECDLGPRNVTITASMPTENEAANEQDVERVAPPISRISLADADPAGKPLPKHRQSTVTGTEGTASFTPDDVRPRRKKKKEEL
ncbi:hypothetical protein B566_EDAN009361 [Ephemera danica]|nr:hypothetical protein B566_EDAN009361 [Ephemera danica]